MEQYASKNELTIFYHEMGGSGDPLPTDQASLLTSISNLPQAAATSPTPFRMTLSRYEDLPSWPRGKKGWVYTKLEGIVTQYMRFRSLRDQTQSMVDNSSSYILNHGVTLQGLKDLTDELDRRVASLQGEIQQCLDSQGSNCDMAADDAAPDYAFRVRLPVAARSFDADVTLINAIQDRDTKQAALDQAPDKLKKAFGGPGNIVILNPQFLEKVLAPYRTRLAQAQQVVSQLQSDYPEALKGAIKRQWIEIPGRTRCEKDFPGCLSYSEIDAWGQKIVVH